MTPVFKIREDVAGNYYALLQAANGQSILRTNVYTSKGKLREGIKSIQRNAAEARVVDEA